MTSQIKKIIINYLKSLGDREVSSNQVISYLNELDVEFNENKVREYLISLDI